MIRAQASFKPSSRNLQESTASAKKNLFDPHISCFLMLTQDKALILVSGQLSTAVLSPNFLLFAKPNRNQLKPCVVWKKLDNLWQMSTYIDTLRGGQTLRGGVDGQQMLTQRSLRVT